MTKRKSYTRFPKRGRGQGASLYVIKAARLMLQHPEAYTAVKND